MVGSEHLGRCIHALMLVEESTHVTSKRPVFGLSGGVQRSCSLFIGTAYLSPADRAGGAERRQLILAPCAGVVLFVLAAVGICNLATPFFLHPLLYLLLSHARSGPPLSPLPSRPLTCSLFCH